MRIQSEQCADWCLAEGGHWSAPCYCALLPSKFCPLVDRKHFFRSELGYYGLIEYGAGMVWRCTSLTCHVAVYQLWSDGAAAIHVNEIVPRRPASVFVGFTGLLVYR